MVPAVPVMPTEARVNAYTGMLHLKLLGDSYVRASLPTIPPADYVATVAAIKACPQVPSLSGSGNPYFLLTIEPQPDRQSCILKAGEVVVGRVAVYPEVPIISVDVPLDEQIKEGIPKSEGPQDPSVN